MRDARVRFDEDRGTERRSGPYHSGWAWAQREENRLQDCGLAAAVLTSKNDGSWGPASRIAEIEREAAER